MLGIIAICAFIYWLLRPIVLSTEIEEEKPTCRVHSWERMEQPGMPGVIYLKCRHCDHLPDDSDY